VRHGLSQIVMLGKGEIGLGISMNTLNKDAAGAGWRKAGALGLAIAVIGLPINNISDYALLLISAVMILCGDVRATPRAWVAAAVIVMQPFWSALCRRRAFRGYTFSCRAACRNRAERCYRRMTAEFEPIPGSPTL
jgi:hypothetical protein